MNIDKLNSIMDFAAKYIEAGYFKKKDQVYYGQPQDPEGVLVLDLVDVGVCVDVAVCVGVCELEGVGGMAVPVLDTVWVGV